MQLKMISANIRYETEQDKKHNWPYRKNFLADSINKFNPLILGSQEGRQGQIKEFSSLLNNLTLIDQHRSWIDERMYPSLYLDLKAIKLIDSTDIWLSETPHIAGSKSFESLFPRLATVALIKMYEDNSEFAVCNVHLDHIKEETRIAQIKVLIAELKKYIGNRPLILLGDFNESPDHFIQDLLCENFALVDYWKEKNQQEETSHHSFQGKAQETGHRIDWILVPELINCDEIFLFKEANAKGVYPSDHYPLFFSGNTHS